MTLTRSSIPNDAINEISILERILSNGKEFTPALARYLLEQGFSDEDNERINDLAQRNQGGNFTAVEQAELRSFANAACLLGVLHAKARRSLKKAGRK